MRAVRLVTAIALVGMGAAIGYLVAPGPVSAAPGGLTAQDYADIQQLYWRYNQGADFGDADLYVSVFVDDAVVRSSDGREHVGKDAIRQFVSRSQARRPAGDTGRRHWNSSWRIMPTAAGAQGRSYWLMLDVSSGSPTNYRSGYYEDEYVRTSDGWLIRNRTIVGDDRPGATSVR